MMKKALLSLMMAALCLPVAFGQSKDGRAFVTETKASCTPYTWSADGVTYSEDTVVTYITDDTIFVLEFTRLSLVVDTAEVRNVNGGCMATWNGKNWATEGLFFDTVPTTGNGCDTVVKIQVTLSGTDSITSDTTVCGSYTAPWGQVYTASRYFDTVITGACNVEATFNLTVNPEYLMPVTEVTGGCSYSWQGITISDTAVHSMTLTTVEGQCDSIVRLRVTAYTGVQNDTFSIVACDTYTPSWRNAVTASGLYAHDTAYGSYYVNPTTTGDCQHHEVYDINIVTSMRDSNGLTPTAVTAGCSYTWAGQTYTDTNTHYHLFQSVIGGCDSMAGIKVTYTGHNYDTTFAEYCGDVYNWKTSCPSLPLPGAASQYRYTENTTTTVTVADTASGCTTHYTLVLTFYTKSDTVNQYYCGDTYTYTYKRFNTNTGVWQNVTTDFTTSGYHSVSADGQDTLFSVASGSNCKTYRTLNLNLNIPEQRFRTDSIDTAACESFRFKADRKYGRWITLTASTEEDVVHEEHSQNNVNRCYDSIVHVKLVINHNSFIERTATACDSYTWTEFDGNTYTATGVYRDTLDVRTDEGCLQIGRLSLTINNTPVIDIEGDWMLAPGDGTLLKAVPAAGSDEIRTYKWYVRDTLRSSADTLVLSEVWQNTDVRLESTSTKNCTATNWITVTANVGIDEVETLQVNIYPNPASRYLNIESAETMASVVVYNAVGQQVMLHTVNSTGTTLDLGTLATGNYTLRIVGTDGSMTTRKFIVNK